MTFDQATVARADEVESQDQAVGSSTTSASPTPHSSILGTVNSPRFSSVRFSSGSDSPHAESLPSLGSQSGSSTTSPSFGPSRPSLASRSLSKVNSSYAHSFTSSTQYIRPTPFGGEMHVRRAWPSTKLKGKIEKPWMKHRDPAHRWAKAIFWAFVGLGFAVGAIIMYMGVRSIRNPGKLCIVMDDDFSNGFDQFWSREVRLDGYGNNQFEWTTAFENNSFIQDNTLYLVPTLTEDYLGTEAITNGYTLNLTIDGTCTSTNVSQCGAVSNSSMGTMINPVMSSRLTTKNKASIKYGKVEVTARMPTGDWVWPAIWMMPTDDKYGTWPRSGEIDIAESRGNNNTYGKYGNDFIQSALHWGPASQLDSYRKTWGYRQDRASGYTKSFHKYTLEWTDKYITTYIDNKVTSVMDVSIGNSFWDRGSYPQYFKNGSDTQQVTNPWYASESNAAPFDQDFYLILNVAVGGTNGFFPDNLGSKPWLDSSFSAMNDFWDAKDKWYPSWPADHTQRGMAVKSVKMWQKC